MVYSAKGDNLTTLIPLVGIIRPWLTVFFGTDMVWFYCSQTLELFGIPLVADDGHSRNALCPLNVISTFALLSLGRYLCWWNICPRGIPPSSHFLTLTCFIRYVLFKLAVPKSWNYY
jgi:hypothetical protein